MESFPIKWLRITILVMVGCLINACGNPASTQQEKKEKINSEQKADIEQQGESFMKRDTTELEILPTMQSACAARNQIWVGTFQIVWNDLMDNITQEPVTFFNGDTPAMVEELNKRSFTKDALSENAYYAKWGEALPALKKEIEQAIQSKFGENSEVLEGLDWTVEPDVKKYVLYAMLKKDLQFVKKLDDKGQSLFRGSKQEVSYFGAEGEPSIGIQFYNNEDDFAVTLKTKQGDLVHLYRTDLQGKTLAELYTQMKKEAKSYKGNHNFVSTDLFKAPKLDFKSKREFSELYGKPIRALKSSRWMGLKKTFEAMEIINATETVELEMDEVGAKVKSESLMQVSTYTGALGSHTFTHSYRYFYVTGPYALFIEEPGKQPYLAMYITDVAKLQSAEQKGEMIESNEANNAVTKTYTTSAEEREASRLKYMEGLDAFNRANTAKNASQVRSTSTAAINRPDQFGETPLLKAVKNGKVEEVKNLIAQGADVNSVNPLKESVLIVAVNKNQPEIVKLLVEAGADVNYKDNFGKSILKTAEQKGYTEIADFLKSAGAKE